LTPALPEVTSYEELRHAISQARSESRLRTEQAVEEERVREAWQIGRLIDAHVLEHRERADYGQQVLLRLAQDLGMSDTELRYMLEFARAYPIYPHAGKLSWSDYRDLLAVNVPEAREVLGKRAARENWSRDRLRQEVKALKGTGSSAAGGVPVPLEHISPEPQPGKPGTYRVIRAKVGPYAGTLALDLGFSSYVSLSSLHPKQSAFEEGDLVLSSLKAVGSPEDLFSYEAYLSRVLDGDTLEAVVDLGFGFATTQVLRLRGIDAPELVTADGRAAKEALEKMLSQSSRVLIRSVKSDKYDRYLVDVYCLDGQGTAVYVNNRLLADGYAVKVK